jgi:hypothetical protein
MGLSAKELIVTATRAPHRGQIVDYYPIGTLGNATDVQAQVAIVTKVVTPDIVNLQIFYDAASITARTNVPRKGSTEWSCWDYAKEF